MFRARKRGSALVEFILMLPFYATLLFGTMEFGQIFYDRVQLTTACREGVRRAALGRSLSEIKTTTQRSGLAMSLTITTDQITIEYNDKIDGTGNWVAAADSSDGTTNSIPGGYLCRVKVSGWQHRLVTGSMFSWLPGVSGGYFPMSAEEVMVRN
jgi:Flp pilus assembly protein TadG